METIMLAALAFLVGGLKANLLFTVPHLTAAWAVVSRRPAPRRLLLPVGLWVTFFLFGAATHEYAPPVMVGLSMLAVALPLWLVRPREEGRLRFTLGAVFQAITWIALILGLCVQLAIHEHLPHVPLLFLVVPAGLASVTTLAAMGATLGRRPKYQRAMALTAWLLVCGWIVRGWVFGGRMPWDAHWMLAGALASHALLVIGAICLWSHLQAQQEYSQHVIEHCAGRQADDLGRNPKLDQVHE